jgi:SSS family solute:Na+ symporter
VRVDGREIAVTGDLLQPLTRRTNDIVRLVLSTLFLAVVIFSSLITRSDWVGLEKSVSRIVGVLTPAQSNAVYLVYGVVINLQNFGVDQNYVQRYHTSRSDAEARKSVWLGGLAYLPVSAVFFFIGTALFAYYTTHPDARPAAYRDPGKSDSVFPWFIVTVLPPGITGLLIASIFAAAMSTISSSLNSTATIILNDYYSRYFRPQATERQKMRVLHVATIVVGAIGIAIGLAMISVKSALDAWWMPGPPHSGANSP